MSLPVLLKSSPKLVRYSQKLRHNSAPTVVAYCLSRTCRDNTLPQSALDYVEALNYNEQPRELVFFFCSNTSVSVHATARNSMQ